HTQNAHPQLAHRRGNRSPPWPQSLARTPPLTAPAPPHQHWPPGGEQRPHLACAALRIFRRPAPPDGATLARAFLRLLDLKDEAHYDVMVVAPRRARDALRWAAKLVDRAA